MIHNCMILLKDKTYCDRAESIFRFNRIDYTKTSISRYEARLSEEKQEKLRGFDFIAVIRIG